MSTRPVEFESLAGRATARDVRVSWLIAFIVTQSILTLALIATLLVSAFLLRNAIISVDLSGVNEIIRLARSSSINVEAATSLARTAVVNAANAFNETTAALMSVNALLHNPRFVVQIPGRE